MRKLMRERMGKTSNVRNRCFPLLSVLLACACCHSARAQDSPAPARLSSELGHQNLSRVAASAADIKAILVKDAGLMVEIKRWLAKDATAHGQMVSDSDLNDDAIFDRLETDIQFRSVATTLLQRYGYLVPTLNPNSQAAKGQEFLFQERTRLMAANQDEALAARRQGKASKWQNQPACDSQLDADCNVAQAPGDASAPSPQHPQAIPPTDSLPDESRPPSTPRDNRENQLLLTQTDEESAGTFPSLPMGVAYLEGSAEAGDVLPASAADKQNPGDTFPVAGENTAEPNGADRELPGSNERDLNSAASRPSGVSADRPDGTTVNVASLDRREMNPRVNSRLFPVKAVRPAEPELVRASSPYKEIPSLYDMYVQAIPRPAVPERFGAEVFENGIRDAQLIPMDLPAGPDYVVGPGDGLSIDLWGGVTQRIYRVVDREGRVSLPEVGPLLVNGKSLADVQENLQQILRLQFRHVSADVSLARLRTIRIYEVGDVAKPGAYDISSLSTPLNALFAAGGPTPRGSLRTVRHLRGHQLIEVVDLYDLLLHGVKSDLQRLENGDTVLVPSIGPQVTVEGMVRRPAIYELKEEKSLASVLELAGGLLPTATLRHIEVQRLVAHDKQTMLSLDVPEIEGDSEITNKLQAFEIHDGDRIRVFPIAPYNQDVVYLEGHVIRPGRYAYRSDMRVTDVIASYKDLLPEPANRYAEIIRLNPPDFHPSVQGFNLADALANPSQAPVLHSLDTIRVFSRFDFENPPMVSVWGEVRGPGTYPTSGQVHLSDAVHLAGGVSPDAKTDDAQVFRYLPNGESEIFSVNLSHALEGDPAANILLLPRDRLLIHRNPEAVQPPNVQLQGEVGKPGRYPYTANMTVGDLIRVGGGLEPSADTQTADLIHYSWATPGKLTGQHQAVAISAALAGDAESNLRLNNGDVLTVRQLPGWNDLGASITVKGEVKNTGSYGIRPGERLSSVIQRAGGFAPDAYVYGAVLQRVQVRELEGKEQIQMILRVKALENNLELAPDTDAQQKKAKEMSLQQYQNTVTQLSSNPPVGRVAILISPDINRWKDTPADVEVRAGDTLVVPKRPGFVMVSGQVFNPTAVSYRPGKSARWYLGQSGGPTPLANKRAIFVVRADGSMIGGKESLWSGNSLGAVLQPGDTVFVPEKAIGGGVQWQAVLLAAQVASSVASSVFIAAHY